MNASEKAAREVAAVFTRYDLTYDGTKAVVAKARKRAGLKAPKRKKGSVRRLSAEEQAAFIDAAYATGGGTGLMLQMLLETGARIQEFVALRIEDVSFAERLVVIERGKGDKRREVPIRRELARLLQMHVADRQAGPLFKSRQKGRGVPYQYSPRRIQQIVKAVARSAGIVKDVHPHLLRHTMATHLLNLGMAIDEVRLFLGHENLATTQHYAKTATGKLRSGFDSAVDGAAFARQS